MNILKKEFSWESDGVVFTVKNVPHEIHGEFESPLIDMTVALTISYLCDLMTTGEIDSTDLNYDNFKSVIYEN